MHAQARTIAVYGGSFNPPHNAHVQVAKYLSTAPGIDELWIVPTYQHAFDKALPEFSHRLRMCQAAFATLARTQVLDIERELGGRSRMVRTLGALQQRHPDVQLRLVIGSDLIEEFSRWSEPERIREIAPLWIVRREGSDIKGASGPLFPAISSTDVRERLRRGADVSRSVPAAVIDYIAEHALYRDATPSPHS